MTIGRLACAVTAVLVLASGCGEPPPTRAEVEKAFRTGVTRDGSTTPVKLDTRLASCAADVIAEVKLSDDDLRALVATAKDHGSEISSTGTAAVKRVEETCGGGSRPGLEEVSGAFRQGVSGSDTQLTSTQADCAAKVFRQSRVSDQALRAIVDSDKGFKESAKDDAELQKAVPALRKCAS